MHNAIINAGDKYHRFVGNSPAGQMGVPFKAGPTRKNQDSRIKNGSNYPVEPRQIEMESFAAKIDRRSADEESATVVIVHCVTMRRPFGYTAITLMFF